MFDSKKQFSRRSIDALRNGRIDQIPRTSVSRGWMQLVREALGMPQEVFAVAMGLQRQRVGVLEQRELTGDIKLSQLRAAAEALGCELVYAFVPREPLESVVARRARAVAVEALKAVDRTMQLEDQAEPISEADIADYVVRHIRERDLWRAP